MCKISFIGLQIHVFCVLFAYLVYIILIIFWNHIERLCLAHLKVLSSIVSYIPHLMPYLL